MKTIFKKTVSKGSAFNQIYVPKNMSFLIEPGDLVEVKLLKKKSNIQYTNLGKLSEFKENLVKEIFYFLNQFDDVKICFIVGSFLTEKINYNDIDIILQVNKKTEKFEKVIYSKLIDKFNIKFHLLTITEESLKNLLKICPLTIAMFEKFVSDKKVKFEHEKIIDKNHIQMLLMMPEDLLDIDVNSRVFFDNLRRLATVEMFLGEKDINSDEINKELKKIMGDKLFDVLKSNDLVDEDTIKFIRELFIEKIKKIKRVLKIE